MWNGIVAAVSCGLLAAAALGQTPSPPLQTAPASIGTPHQCKGHYPPDAVDEKREGRTTIGFFITPQGSVSDPKVLRSSGHADLDQAAVACSRAWQYRPALLEGRPVATPWKVFVVWLDDEPPTPLSAAIRPLRRDVWHCVWESAAAKALPTDFVALLEVHIRFSTWLRPISVDISQSSGNAAFDKTAETCARNSPHLANVEANRGDAIGASTRIAWWHTP